MAKAKTAGETKLAEAKAKGAGAQDLAQLRPAADPVDEKLLPTKGVVARGKTVINEHGEFTQGMTVTGPKDEIARLRRLKFLVDPRQNLLPMGNGPRFFHEDAAAKDAPEPT